MDLQTLRQQPHLSASSINTYLDCGLCYKFQYIDKIPWEQKSDALVFGSAMHKVLEYYHQNRMIGESISILDMQAEFEKVWREACSLESDINFKSGCDVKSYIELGKNLIATYVSDMPRTDYTILALEEAFALQIPEVPLPIIGAIDMLEEDASGTIILTDHKTSSKAYAKDEIDENFQLTIYSLAMKNNGYADRDIILKFDCLVKTQKPKFLQYYTVRTEEDEQRAVKIIQSVWDGISKGVFIPKFSWKCRGCSFKIHCQNWFNGRPE
jgi:putative RecB family exonuclease